MKRPWSYLVRDYWSTQVLFTSDNKYDAVSFARLHTKLNDTDVQVCRVGTWWKSGQVLTTWTFGGAFDDWPGDDW